MLKKTCPECGANTYSANSDMRCVECGENLSQVKTKPAGRD